MSDLSAFLATSVMEPLDPDRAKALLSAFPFVAIPGAANIRDIGGLPVMAPSPDGRKLVVRKGKMYRAASLNHITPEGKKALQALNIGAVFDLRTLYEVRKYAKISPDDLDPRAGLVDLAVEGMAPEDEGIKVYHNPLIELSTLSPKDEFAMLQRYAKGDEGFVEDYAEMLEVGSKSYGTMLRYIVEESKLGGKACLWHCHTGKDRTGVFAALVLELLGVSDEAIAQDYAMTRLGLEPIRELLREQSKALIESYPELALALAACNAGAMIKFLDLLRTKYGGAKGYFKSKCGFTDEELDLLRTTMLVEEVTNE